VEARFITNHNEIQADHFNSEGHVHSVLGQKRRSAFGLCLKAPKSIAGVCCDTLQKLRCLIQNKRRGILSWGVAIIHDNTRPHTAAATQNLITKFGWEQFDHPPYIPDFFSLRHSER